MEYNTLRTQHLQSQPGGCCSPGCICWRQGSKTVAPWGVQNRRTTSCPPLKHMTVLSPFRVLPPWHATRQALLLLHKPSTQVTDKVTTHNFEYKNTTRAKNTTTTLSIKEFKEAFPYIRTKDVRNAKKTHQCIEYRTNTRTLLASCNHSIQFSHTKTTKLAYSRIAQQEARQKQNKKRTAPLTMLLLFAAAEADPACTCHHPSSDSKKSIISTLVTIHKGEFHTQLFVKATSSTFPSASVTWIMRALSLASTIVIVFFGVICEEANLQNY